MMQRGFKKGILDISIQNENEVLVQGEKLAMAAINIIEIESDDDLVILDEMEDIAPNFSFGIDSGI